MLRSSTFRRQLRILAATAALAIGISLLSGAVLVISYDRAFEQVLDTDMPELTRLAATVSDLADLHSGLVALVAEARGMSDEQAIYLRGREFTRRLDALAGVVEEQARKAGPGGADEVSGRDRWQRVLEALGKFRASSLTAVEMLTVSPALSDRYLMDSALGLNVLNQGLTDQVEARHKAVEERLARLGRDYARRAIATGVGVAILSIVVFVLIGRLTRKLGADFIVISGTLDELGKGNTDVAIDPGGEAGEMGRVLGSLVKFREALQEVEFQKFAVDQHAIVSSSGLDGNITFVNDHFCRISGYARDELIGRNHRIVKSGAHPPEFYRQMWRTIARGEVWHGEIQNRKKNGESYWVAATIVPFLGLDGKPQRYMSIRTDITGQKALEAQLQSAWQVAEHASQAKSMFLANMSHEIRTPMNGVIGMTELALDATSEEERREYLGIVKSSAESLLGILNDILDFSKIEAGKLLIERVAFDLRRTLSDVLRTWNLPARAKGLELVCDIGDGVPDRVFGDPVRLRQVLNNLLSNAVKFTERGEIVFAVVPAGGPPAKPNLQFSVRDTGIGIAPDKLDHVFESFAQADNSTTRRYGGTGLGLTISDRLVRMMGGRMWVESCVGEGSVFRFTLSLDAEAADPADALDPRFAGRRALVVDDNATSGEAIGRQLARWAITTELAASADRALDRLQAPPVPDVVIADARMPEMDGFALSEWMVRQPALAAVPLLLLLDGTEAGDAHRCRTLGIAAYAAKPMTDRDLAAVLARALGAREAPGPAGTASPGRDERQAPPSRGEVLLVEDNDVNRMVAVRLLENWGYRVTVAEDGRRALDLVDAGRHFDVALMDMQMPVMGGLEATREIRRLEGERAWPRLPIVAMTANAMQGDREACLQAGMDDYIPKPIKPAALAAALERHMVRADTDSARVGDYAAEFDYAGAVAAVDRDVVNALAPVFGRQYREDLEAVRIAIGSGAAAEALHRVHGLKGILAAFDAEPARRLAAEIETLLRAGDLADAARLHGALAREVERLAAMLLPPQPA
ncbi:MAG: response regulator [Rhodocyclaceae bacterium]|nr:response regulator [Rhodocyclaceae bacterium]